MVKRVPSDPPATVKVTAWSSGSVAVSVCTNATPSKMLAVAAEVTVGGVLVAAPPNTVRLLMLDAAGSLAAVSPMSEPSNSSCPVATVPPFCSVRVTVSATTSKLSCATPA